MCYNCATIVLNDEKSDTPKFATLFLQTAPYAPYIYIYISKCNSVLIFSYLALNL